MWKFRIKQAISLLRRRACFSIMEVFTDEFTEEDTDWNTLKYYYVELYRTIKEIESYCMVDKIQNEEILASIGKLREMGNFYILEEAPEDFNECRTDWGELEEMYREAYKVLMKIEKGLKS